MAYLLNLCYLALLTLASPWLIYQAITKGKYREGFGQKFFGLVPVCEPARFRVWFHAVSFGEVNLLGTLLDEAAALGLHWDCVISTTTKTGYDLARKKYPHLTVFYCPLDFSWAVRCAMRRVSPDLLVLAELELWPNLIQAAEQAGAKIAVVNARLSSNSYRGYSRIAWLLRPLLSKLSVVAAQSRPYAERFRALGAPDAAVEVTGSLKFDGAHSDRRNPWTRQFRQIGGIGPQDVVFLAGSTVAPEEELALAAYKRLKDDYPDLKFILVPRHPERFNEVARILDNSDLPWSRRSQLTQKGPPLGKRVLLVDAMGELGYWWGLADIAFVGGSMGTRGGQNMIEPAAYGAAVSFGPSTENFRDVVDALLSAEAAQVVCDAGELEAFVRRCLEDRFVAQGMGQRARQLVAEGQGATARTLHLLARLDPQTVPSRTKAA